MFIFNIYKQFSVFFPIFTPYYKIKGRTFGYSNISSYFCPINQLGLTENGNSS